jgi:hypothetical protein
MIQVVLRDLEVSIEAYVHQWRLEFHVRKEFEEDTDRDNPHLRAVEWRGQQR